MGKGLEQVVKKECVQIANKHIKLLTTINLRK